MYQLYSQRNTDKEHRRRCVYNKKVESFTHGRVYDIIVSKEFLGEGDRVLLIDDFLANGKSLRRTGKISQRFRSRTDQDRSCNRERIPARWRLLKKTDTLRDPEPLKFCRCFERFAANLVRCLRTWFTNQVVSDGGGMYVVLYWLQLDKTIGGDQSLNLSLANTKIIRYITKITFNMWNMKPP